MLFSTAHDSVVSLGARFAAAREGGAVCGVRGCAQQVGEEKAEEGRGPCKASLEGPTCPRFCRQNRAGQNQRGGVALTHFLGVYIYIVKSTSSLKKVKSMYFYYDTMFGVS
jgi:hypothetical protein